MLENRPVHRRHICPTTYLRRSYALCQSQPFVSLEDIDVLGPTLSSHTFQLERRLHQQTKGVDFPCNVEAYEHVNIG